MPWAEIGIFWISVVLAIITVTATIINYLFFRSQIDPDVLVYVSPDEKRPSLIILIIENIGHGLAKDIKFTAARPIPKKAYGIGDDAKVPENMDYGPLINGIPALGPGSKRIITWGQYGGLKKGIGDDVVEITVTYKSEGPLGLFKKKHKTVCPIDIKSFEGTGVSDKNWDKKTAEQIEKIAKILDQAASGFRSFKIEITEQQEIDENL